MLAKLKFDGLNEMKYGCLLSAFTSIFISIKQFLFVSLVLFGLFAFSVETVLAETAREAQLKTYKSWSDDPLPEGQNKNPYSPGVAPDFGEGFNPDGSKVDPDADPDAVPPPYDAYKDERHPLKNPDGPPREWLYQQETVDADYDGKPDKDKDGNLITKDKEVTVDKDNDGEPDLDDDGFEITEKVPVEKHAYVQETVDANNDGKPDLDKDGNEITKDKLFTIDLEPPFGVPDRDEDGNLKLQKHKDDSKGDAAPNVKKASADIDWGERYYGSQFDQLITITNKCFSVQPVTITVDNLPYLTIPDPNPNVPPGDTTITGTVQMPPPPPPPLLTGAPGEPGWGHVDFGPIFIPPGQFPPPKLHQPNFALVDGTIEIWHPWDPSGDCQPELTTFTVTGHIHFKPPEPEGGGGPQKLFTYDVCEVYWNIGEPPSNYQGEDCTDKFRELAARDQARSWPAYILNAPEQWEWLPSKEQMQQMSSDELRSMKTRAEAIKGVNYGKSTPADTSRSSVFSKQSATSGTSLPKNQKFQESVIRGRNVAPALESGSDKYQIKKTTPAINKY